MATIIPKILKKNRKQDGTWNVVYRLTHNRKTRYIRTRHYISEESVANDDDISIDFVIDYLSDDIKKYRKRINDIEEIEHLTVDDLKKLITIDSQKINFIEFIKHHIELLKSEGRSKTSKPFLTVMNTLIDYVGPVLPTSKITSRFLREYEQYIRSPRTITRSQGTVNVTMQVQVSDKGINNHMSAFRTLFNAAKRHYNDEDTGNILIKNNPFSRYRIIPKKRKKHKNLSVVDIRRIRDLELKTRRGSLARDLFMLSFYMCGMNAVDIYNNWQRLKLLPDRIGYNRSKTKHNREDEAYIEVLVPQEAKNILAQLEMNYSTIDILNNTLSIGLRKVRDKLNLDEVTMLHARHSFATIARNDLNINKDEVALSLNHVSEESRITDTYIAPDWSKVHRVQSAVISKIK